MLITLALLHREKGRGSIPPTHASRRHADKVDTTMPVPTPRIQENICGLGQPRTAPGKRGVVTRDAQVWGLDHVMISCLLEDRGKGPLHYTMAQLKAGQVGVAVAQEGVVTECVHWCATTRACGICCKHLHA